MKRYLPLTIWSHTSVFTAGGNGPVYTRQTRWGDCSGPVFGVGSVFVKPTVKSCRRSAEILMTWRLYFLCGQLAGAQFMSDDLILLIFLDIDIRRNNISIYKEQSEKEMQWCKLPIYLIYMHVRIRHSIAVICDLTTLGWCLPIKGHVSWVD